MEERIVAPDPVEDPEGYQQALLTLLGGRDPIEVLAQTPDVFATSTDGLSEEILRQAPEPGEWSVEQLLAHLFDAEVVYGFRWRLTAAEDGSSYPAYNQEVWVGLPHQPFHGMLAAYTELRRSNAAFLRELPKETWSHVAHHFERGDQTLDTAVKVVAGHDLAHLKQLEQTLAAVGPAPTL